MIKKVFEISFKKEGEHSRLYLQLESEIIQGPKTEKARKSTIYELLKQFEIQSSGE